MNLKKVIISIYILTFYVIGENYAQGLAWAKSIGEVKEDIGYSVISDSFGNVYSTGWFEGTVDFDSGSGISNLTSLGNQDIFIVKHDINGNFVWAKSIGSIGQDKAYSLVIDNSNNIYMTGLFEGTVDFDSGSGVSNLTSFGGQDIFMVKYDINGNFVWAKSIGGIDEDQGSSISLNKLNNHIYITGRFRNIVDFDTSTNIFNLTSAGGDDIFISKFDINGNFVWAKRIGGNNNDMSNSIAIDIWDNVYTTGSFRSTVDFDPGSGVSNLVSNGSSEDIFISKLDINGNFVWAKRIGGSSTDVGSSIISDALGNVYITGNFIGFVDFDPGLGEYIMMSTGAIHNDIFVLQLETAVGFFSWAKTMGQGRINNIGKSIAIDETNNLYVVGSGQIAPTLLSTFINKIDKNGKTIWNANIASGIACSCNGVNIHIDASNNIYTTGYFSGTADFNPDVVDVTNLTSNGNSLDIFVSKLVPCTGNINTSSLSNAEKNVPYNQEITQNGLSGNVTWSIIAGILPDGLVLNKDTGVISGLPTQEGQRVVTIRATNNTCSLIKEYIISVDPTPVIADTKQELKYYPNPIFDKINIVLDNIWSDKYEINIINILGDIIVNKTFDFKDVPKEIEIILDNQPAGVYILQIIYSQGKQVFKIVKS
ncbi:MAG: SBBP repeat-containing protein [Raineya sp.]|jgi:hypothetical protein|nr:SBBP repeat-containing protein [Raineya sp.]